MAINATNYDGTKDYQIPETKEILDSKESVMANATSKMISGGLSLKEAFNEIAGKAQINYSAVGEITFPTAPENQMWIFFAQRYSVSDCIILLGNFLEGSWHFAEIYKNNTMSYDKNSLGTVVFKYNGSTTGVFAGAIQIH